MKLLNKSQVTKYCSLEVWMISMIVEMEPPSKDSNNVCNRVRHITRIVIKLVIEGGT